MFGSRCGTTSGGALLARTRRREAAVLVAGGGELPLRLGDSSAARLSRPARRVTCGGALYAASLRPRPTRCSLGSQARARTRADRAEGGVTEASYWDRRRSRRARRASMPRPRCALRCAGGRARAHVRRSVAGFTSGGLDSHCSPRRRPRDAREQIHTYSVGSSTRVHESPLRRGGDDTFARNSRRHADQPAGPAFTTVRARSPSRWRPAILPRNCSPTAREHVRSSCQARGGRAVRGYPTYLGHKAAGCSAHPGASRAALAREPPAHLDREVTTEFLLKQWSPRGVAVVERHLTWFVRSGRIRGRLPGRPAAGQISADTSLNRLCGSISSRICRITCSSSGPRHDARLDRSARALLDRAVLELVLPRRPT